MDALAVEFKDYKGRLFLEDFHVAENHGVDPGWFIFGRAPDRVIKVVARPDVPARKWPNWNKRVSPGWRTRREALTYIPEVERLAAAYDPNAASEGEWLLLTGPVSNSHILGHGTLSEVTRRQKQFGGNRTRIVPASEGPDRGERINPPQPGESAAANLRNALTLTAGLLDELDGGVATFSDVRKGLAAVDTRIRAALRLL